MMNAIRYIPTSLLLLLCVLNLYLGIIARPDPSFVMYMVFGVVYFLLVMLMISKLRFASLLGFLIPLALLFIYPSMVDFENLSPWSSGIMGAIDAIIVICCLILLLLKL
jgi:hypothetical protein